MMEWTYQLDSRTDRQMDEGMDIPDRFLDGIDSWTDRQMDGGMDIPVRVQDEIRMDAKLTYQMDSGTTDK